MEDEIGRLKGDCVVHMCVCVCVCVQVSGLWGAGMEGECERCLEGSQNVSTHHIYVTIHDL